MSSTGESRKFAFTDAPALLITMVTSCACSAAAATEAGSLTSSASGTASGCVTVFGSRAVAYTFFAPRSYRASTSARPMPRLPPVTRTTEPSMFVMEIS